MVAVLARITITSVFFALLDIMVIINVKAIMVIIVVIIVMYIMSVKVILDAT